MNQTVLHHQVRGDGPPVLLLNGVMMSGLSWGRCAEVVAQRARVVTCDFRGQFLTPGPAHARIIDNVADVVALLDHLEIEKAHVVGASFGASVAILTALEAPARVASLVPVTGTGHTDATMRALQEGWTTRLREAVQGGSPREVFEEVLTLVHSPRYIEENRAEIDKKLHHLETLPLLWYREFLTLLAAASDYDARPLLDRIDCPALVVAAELDRIIPVERSRELAESIPGARLEVMPRVGHGAVFERPVELAARILRFVGGL